jgi:general secretion pathway protein D
LPGLGELPVLGRLFGTQSDNSQKTEIVLSITPRLIRNMPLPTLLDSEFESGTEINYKVLSYGQQGKVPAKAAASVPAPAPQLAAAVPKANLPVVSDGRSRLLWQMPAQVQAGERFSATLLMTPSAAVSRIPYSLSYDPKTLEVVSVVPGELLKQGGVDTSYSSHIDRDKGIISALEVRPGAPAPAGGTLVTVTFQALDSVGSTPLGIADIKPTGSDSTPIAVELPAAQTISIVPK